MVRIAMLEEIETRRAATPVNEDEDEDDTTASQAPVIFATRAIGRVTTNGQSYASASSLPTSHVAVSGAKELFVTVRLSPECMRNTSWQVSFRSVVVSSRLLLYTQ